MEGPETWLGILLLPENMGASWKGFNQGESGSNLHHGKLTQLLRGQTVDGGSKPGAESMEETFTESTLSAGKGGAMVRRQPGATYS